MARKRKAENSNSDANKKKKPTPGNAGQDQANEAEADARLGQVNGLVEQVVQPDRAGEHESTGVRVPLQPGGGAGRPKRNFRGATTEGDKTDPPNVRLTEDVVTLSDEEDREERLKKAVTARSIPGKQEIFGIKSNGLFLFRDRVDFDTKQKLANFNIKPCGLLVHYKRDKKGLVWRVAIHKKSRPNFEKLKVFIPESEAILREKFIWYVNLKTDWILPFRPPPNLWENYVMRLTNDYLDKEKQRRYRFCYNIGLEVFDYFMLY